MSREYSWGNSSWLAGKQGAGIWDLVAGWGIDAVIELHFADRPSPGERPTAVRGTCLVVYIRYEATISGALRRTLQRRASAAAEIVVNTNMAKISATS